MNKGVLKRLYRYIAGNKKYLYFVIISAVLANIFMLAAPYISGRAIDFIRGEGDVDFGMVIKISSVLLGVYVLNALFTWGMTVFTNHLSNRTIERMRSDAFKRLSRLPLSYFDNHSHGDIISRLTNDTDAVSDGLLQGITQLFAGLVTVIGSLAVMFSLNYKIALCVVAVTILCVFVSRFIAVNSGKMFRMQAAVTGELNGYVSEIVGNMKVVKAFGYEERSGEAFGEINSRLYDCGQCIAACPVGALYEKDNTDDVLAAINDSEKHVVVQTAPAVRAALGEEFGYPMGTDVEGKMAAALRRIGFDKVFDTNFGADLTIMEEANEFIERVQSGGVLPMITSCSPGWVKYCEHYYPDQLSHLSSCKSPQQMFGAVTKTYYAEKMGIDPKNIVCVSVMPCTAKKFEINRADQDAAGMPDVDISITTRELARLIRKCGIDFNILPDEGFDDPLGESSGAGVIFGATGGVMEAALRTAVEKLTGEELQKLDFTEVRGTDGIKEATYTVGGKEVKVAVASGLNNARVIMDKIRAGEADYHFVEIMCCEGGCVNGGGQPLVHADVRNFTDVKALRAKALYSNDTAKTIRKSHENPSIKKLYEEYLGEPGSEKAHHLLHTSYVERTIN